MRIFTPEAAEQVISLLCYSRTEDRYNCGFSGQSEQGAFRLVEAVERAASRLALSDEYDHLSNQTITVASALWRGLLEPSWEDLAAKLYLNDQDILYMCLMSYEEPVCLRLIDAVRIMAYRNRHNEKAKAKKFTYLPGQPKKLQLPSGKAKVDPALCKRRGPHGPRDQSIHAA